jgi:hypothetical protein
MAIIIGERRKKEGKKDASTKRPEKETKGRWGKY